MHSHDKQGRPYAKLSELHAGSVVIVDDGFTCIRAWSKRVVYSDGEDLLVRCTSGLHNLDGQLQDDGDTLMGVYHDA